MLKSLIVWYRSVEKERHIYKELEQYDKTVLSGEQPAVVKLVRSLIKQRQKRRNCTVTCIQNAFRILMLNYRLKLPIKKYLHPIFISVCGIISNLVSLFKIWEKQTNGGQVLVRVADVKRRAAM